MRKVVSVLMAGGLALLVGGAAGAKAGTQRISGALSKIDATARTFAVKENAHEVHFELAPDAKIMSGSKPESLGSLKVGQSVSVTYATEDGTHVAGRIEVAKPLAKAGAASQPEKTSSGGSSGN